MPYSATPAIIRQWSTDSIRAHIDFVFSGVSRNCVFHKAFAKELHMLDIIAGIANDSSLMYYPLFIRDG